MCMLADTVGNRGTVMNRFLLCSFHHDQGSATVDWSLVFGSAAFDMVYNTSMAWGLAPGRLVWGLKVSDSE